LRYWFEADVGVTYDLVTGDVSDWADQSPDGWDVHTPSGGNVPPTFVPDEINGLPGIYFGEMIQTSVSDWGLAHYGGSLRGQTPYPFSENEAHIVYVVCKPRHGTPPGGPPTLGGGMLVTDRGSFARELWVLSPVQQRVARSTGQGHDQILSVAAPSDYSGAPLLILYQWTGQAMSVTVNDTLLATVNLGSGQPSTAFDPVLDTDAAQTLEIGGSSLDETGFQGTIEAVLLAPDADPNPQTIDYLKAKWGPFSPGPFPPVTGN
jgi:hypothetical protein